MAPLSNFLKIIPLMFSSPSPEILSTSQITEESRNMYRQLSTPSEFSFSTSPTIHFSFVPPPTKSAATSNMSNDESVFDSVSNEFFSHDSDEIESKPLALLLPGLDGVGISSSTQYEDLSSNFEFWRMSIDISEDRTSFNDLVTMVVRFLDEATKRNNKEVLLIGESFGGLLAPNVALRLRNRSKRREKNNVEENLHLKGLVMVNPATSYDETQWGSFAPALSSLRHLETQNKEDTNTFPTPYSVLGGAALATTIPDSEQFQQILDIILSEYSGRVPDLEMATEGLASMKEGFDVLAENLPAATLEHRITRWMPVGTSVINSRLSEIDVPSVVVAGSEDKMLPSKKEALRLEKEMPNCERVDIAGSGHFVLDNRVNLTDIILNSHIFPVEESDVKIDPILDWEAPTKEEIHQILVDRVEPIRKFTSPVFFSTDKSGKRRKGLSHIPGSDEGPILFVANHQLLGIDLNLIISQLIEDRDIFVRGLAHPVIFAASNQLENKNRDSSRGSPNGQNELFQKFGAVMVTPRNFYRVMETKQNALLFPGGVREVFHGKGEEYKLFWPEKVDFVRTAAKFNATIVPLSALGAAESANILVDAPDMVKLPFGIGERIANFSANVTAGRFDTEKEGELFTPPFVVPKIPSRFYFMFGRPMSTADLDHRNKGECEKLYTQVKTEMNRGFEDVLSARESDPYKDNIRRILTEQISGKPTPTFGMEEFRS